MFLSHSDAFSDAKCKTISIFLIASLFSGCSQVLQTVDLQIDTIEKSIQDEFVCDDRQINRAVKLKYKFRNYQWNKPKKFMQLVFKSEAASRSMYYKLKKPFSFPTARLFKHQFPIYEKNVLPVLRFIHLRKIQPSSWIRLENFNQIDSKFFGQKRNQLSK